VLCGYWESTLASKIERHLLRRPQRGVRINSTHLRATNEFADDGPGASPLARKKALELKAEFAYVLNQSVENRLV
jgi:hypothetical protein